MTRIYGYSDDLIEIDGSINGEVDCYDHKNPIKFECSDGTIGTIFYDGLWKIDIKNKGDKYLELHFTESDDNKHLGNAEDAAGYSDVLILDDVEWVKVKGKTYR